MITTNNKTYYEKSLQFRSHGITRDPKNYHKTTDRGTMKCTSLVLIIG